MIAIEDFARIHERPEVKFGQTVELSSKTVADTGNLRARAALAYNALAHIGELKQVGSRIVEAQELANAIGSEAADE